MTLTSGNIKLTWRPFLWPPSELSSLRVRCGPDLGPAGCAVCDPGRWGVCEHRGHELRPHDGVLPSQAVSHRRRGRRVGLLFVVVRALWIVLKVGEKGCFCLMQLCCLLFNYWIIEKELHPKRNGGIFCLYEWVVIFTLWLNCCTFYFLSYLNITCVNPTLR